MFSLFILVFLILSFFLDPTGTVTDLKIEWTTSTEAEISWKPVACDQRKGIIQFG